MRTRADVRELNGFRVILVPDHNKAMTNDNWNGYVYEHIVVVEKYLKRPLVKGEVVHHLDGNRANNRIENLLVLLNGQHAKLHQWLQMGAPGVAKLTTSGGFNAEKIRTTIPTYCEFCGFTLQEQQEKFCSSECYAMGARKVKNRPNIKQLQEDINSMSWLAMGRKYGVSDNAVRKWARQYGIL